MRRILFRIIIALLALLGVILGIAAKQDKTPKALLQSWFTRQETVVETGAMDMIPIITSDEPFSTGSDIMTGESMMSGELSDEERRQTQDLLDSLIIEADSE